MTHEEEDRDYCPQSELENALAQSRQEFTDDKEEVNRLRHMGRWVVVAKRAAICPRTDAIMGEQVIMVGDFAKENEAHECLGEHWAKAEDEETTYELLQPIRVELNPPPTPLTDDDIPF